MLMKGDQTLQWKGFPVTNNIDVLRFLQNELECFRSDSLQRLEWR